MSQTTFFVPLADHGLIRARGEDATSFLHNLLTNDITHLPVDGVRHAGLCTPKGRMIASFTIWRESADYLLLLSADILPGILKKLSMYILRSQVKLTDITSERKLLGVAGPNADELIGTLGAMSSLPFAGGTAIRLDAGRFILALPAENASTVCVRLAETARTGTLDDWHLAEIEAGMPRIVAATQEAFTPQMVNYELDAVGGVSFQKGCYPGQEVVARSQYRGTVKRRAQLLLGAVAAPGSEVFQDDQAVGEVLAAAQWAGGSAVLAELQLAAWESDSPLHVTGSGPLLRGALPYAIKAPE